MAIKDYSTDPDMNTTISGINIAEGCAPSGINNAIRQLMADVKAEKDAESAKDSQQDAAIASKLSTSGGTMTGRLDARSGIWMQNLEYILGEANDNNYTTIAFVDGKGTRVGNLELAHYPDGASRITISAINGQKTGQSLGIKVNADGSYQALAGGVEGFLARGTIFAYAGDKVLPGTLLCNGAAVSRTTYAALFSVIGTKYGSGDGSTTFNIPNLIDRFIQYSSTAGTVKDAGLPNITGRVGVLIRTSLHMPIDDMVGAFYGNGVTGQGVTSSLASEKIGDSTRILFDASKANSVYGKSTTVQPPALTMLPLIKY